jgi:hypothetical protein
MELTNRSPLLLQLGKTISGIATIRAYSIKGQYSAASLKLLEKSNTSSFLIAVTERWLGFQPSLTSALVSLLAGTFAV